MDKFRLYEGQTLWYCNRDNGRLGTVTVEFVFRGGFFIRYNNKIYEMKQEALGTRLFFRRDGASCPKDIIKPTYEFYGFDLDDADIQSPFCDDQYYYRDSFFID